MGDFLQTCVSRVKLVDLEEEQPLSNYQVFEKLSVDKWDVRCVPSIRVKFGACFAPFHSLITQVFEEYQRLVEKLIEGFLAAEGTTSKKLFETLQECVKNG